MDKQLWLRIFKIFTLALIVAVFLFFIFSRVIVEEEIDYKELEEARQRQKPFLIDEQQDKE